MIRGPFEVLSLLPDDGLSSVRSGGVEMFPPRSLSFSGDGMGLPFRFTYFLILYSLAFAVLRPRVGSVFTNTDICPISPIPELLGMV